MKIDVIDYFVLLNKGRPARKTIEVPDGLTARQMITMLGVDPDGEIMIMINERPSNENTVLVDNDELKVMPPVSAA